MPEDIEALMNTKHGRDFMWHLLTATGYFVDTFDTDPYVNARNAGGRQVGVWLWAELNAVVPDKVVEMMKENSDER